jgi:ribosomal protein S18 acetylase RimI-like enzyme
VRLTTSTDVLGIRRVLGEAFADDPLFRWLFPDDATRLDASAAWLGLFVERYLSRAPVHVIAGDDDYVAAVAVWQAPGETRLPSATAPPTIGGLLAALLGPARTAELGDALRAIGSVRPTRRHSYLQFLAVSPAHQGHGMGRRLIMPGMAAADAEGVGVHLETTNERNVGFYRSLGFEVSHEIRLEPGGPEMWAMWKAPK